MAERCRLCTSNDDEAVIEHVAAYMWESLLGDPELLAAYQATDG